MIDMGKARSKAVAMKEAEEEIIVKKMHGLLRDDEVGLITHSLGDVWVVFCFGEIITHKPVRSDALKIAEELRVKWASDTSE